MSSRARQAHQRQCTRERAAIGLAAARPGTGTRDRGVSSHMAGSLVLTVTPPADPPIWAPGCVSVCPSEQRALRGGRSLAACGAGIQRIPLANASTGQGPLQPLSPPCALLPKRSTILGEVPFWRQGLLPLRNLSIHCIPPRGRPPAPRREEKYGYTSSAPPPFRFGEPHTLLRRCTFRDHHPRIKRPSPAKPPRKPLSLHRCKRDCEEHSRCHPIALSTATPPLLQQPPARASLPICANRKRHSTNIVFCANSRARDQKIQRLNMRVHGASQT